MSDQVGLPLDRTFINAIAIWAHISGVAAGRGYSPRQITHPITCAVIAQALYVMGHIEKRPINYLEIGVRNGASVALASRFTKGLLYGIDPMDTPELDSEIYMANHSHGWIEKFWQTIDEYEIRGRTMLFPVKSDPFPDMGDIRFGVGFIDGDHSYEWASKDFQNMKEVVDGFIVFDDVDQGRHGDEQDDGPYQAFMDGANDPNWRVGYFSGRTGVLINNSHAEQNIFGHLLGPCLYSVSQSPGEMPVEMKGELSVIVKPIEEEEDAEV